MKKILMIFLATSITFGLTMFINGRDVSTSITSGLAFGIFMTVILGAMNYLLVKRVGGKAESSVRQEKEIEIYLPYKDSFELCKNSLSSINGTKITYENLEKGIIQAKTGVNFQTWGDKLEFHIHKVDEEVSSVWVQSRPTFQPL
ncbi:hypothetical protein [Alkalihalobacterium sp. APHAB7]|uniref:hypothetical protein n=1 Tax=Alkalihalobacterium sp. APHAB7 TaxID=3402081 RepID=UPI003AAF2CD4